jgi:uncharacterized surface protein with fasciclin (FAS1) repeats
MQRKIEGIRDFEILGSSSRGLAICALFCLFLVACKQTPLPTPNELTPLQKLVNSDTSLSFFHRTLLRANEAALLNDASVTLLVPTNDAFRAAGYTQAGLDSLRAYQADLIVRYQFIPSRITVPVGPGYTAYTTLTGVPVYGTSDGTQILFNGIPVTQDTAASGNALVYRLGGLLQTPTDSLNHFLRGDTTLSFLSEAFLRTHLYDSLLLAGGSYTLLAAHNNAFRNAGYDSVGAIDSVDITVLNRLVRYQVVKGLFFIRDLAGLNSLTTVEGGVLTVSHLNGGIQFSGPGNAVPANLLTGDQPAGNGFLVHRIDQVLQP